MTCRRIARKDMTGRYLRGELAPAEAEAFERHCLQCGPCFSSLRQEEKIASFFREGSAQTLPESKPAVRRRLAWTGAALALAVIAVIMIINLRPENRISRIQRLAAFDPPPYQPVTMRGTADTGIFPEAFRQGMIHYQQRDYRAAIPGLRRAVDAQPGNAMARFYLGAALLTAGEPSPALAELEHILLAPAGPYTEESHWYAGKACLRLGDISGARRHFEAVAGLGKRLALPARQILRELP